MKHIVNALKNEIFNQNNLINDLVKRVEISQASYLKDRGNEALFNIWSNNVVELQKVESNIRYLKSAYVTMCNACEIEPMAINAIIAEKASKKVRKPREKKNEEPKSEK